MNVAMTPRLVVLTDFENRPDSLPHLRALCEEASPGQVALVLRDRSLPLVQRYHWGQKLRELTLQTGQALVVADRWDLMHALRADGLHLGASAPLPSRVRPYCPWVSRAWHSRDSLSEIEAQNLDALLISPVFAPLKGNAALGVEGLSRAVQKLRQETAYGQTLLFALGRVDAENAPLAIEAGCDGVACMGTVLHSQGRVALLRALQITHTSD